MTLALAASAAVLSLAAVSSAFAEESGPPSGPPSKPAVPAAVGSSHSYTIYQGSNKYDSGQIAGPGDTTHTVTGDSGSTVTFTTTTSPFASVTGSVVDNSPSQFAQIDGGLGYMVTLSAKDQGAFDALQTYFDNGGTIGSLHGNYTTAFTGQGAAQAAATSGFGVPGDQTHSFGIVCASNGAACSSGAFDIGVDFVGAAGAYSNGGALDFVSSVFLSVHARAGAAGLSQLTGSASAFIDPLLSLDFTGSGLNAGDYTLSMAVTNAASDGFTPGGGNGGVPEPATWALMIAGFGLAGSALRRRRATAA
jgi:hypothetical protein